MWNCVEVIYDFLELYKNLIIEKIWQNFNDRYFNKSYVTNNQCDMFESRENLAMIGVGVGFIENFRVDSGEHMS